ncbi:hypothetical protein LB503_011827 [Fusarium chuoi]|nr:hypothetical protein LB503_011827 [Fusarium chuoi]
MGSVIGTQLDERLIYQATKHVFVGKYAKIRKRGVVETSINNNLLAGNPVQQVVTDHGYNAVAEIVLKLLAEKVYESAAIASQRFPDLPQPSSVQTAVNTHVEAEATGTEQVALEAVELTNSDNSQETGHTKEDIKPLQVYLPFPTEHLLIEKLQKTLEGACYEYGIRELSSIMQERHWDCPEAAELSQWAELLGNKGNLKRQGSDRSLEELLHSIAQIRHTAVHRVRTSSAGLQRFLDDAEYLTRALGTIQLAQNKQSIQPRLEEAQEEIAKQRAELDQKEQDNLRRMEMEDMRYCAQAGERLGKALHLVGKFAVVPENEDPAMGGMDGDNTCLVSDTDSNLDHAEHFEDCSES